MMVRPEVKSLRTQRQQQRSDVPEKVTTFRFY